MYWREPEVCKLVGSSGELDNELGEEGKDTIVGRSVQGDQRQTWVRRPARLCYDDSP